MSGYQLYLETIVHYKFQIGRKGPPSITYDFCNGFIDYVYLRIVLIKVARRETRLNARSKHVF